MHQSLRVIVITVDQSVAGLCQSTLQSEGHTLAIVSSGQEALKLLEEPGRWDTVLFDTTKQPPSTFYILGSLVRKIGSAAVSLIVPLGVSTLRREAERLGIVNLLLKPLNRQDLENWIERHSPVKKETARPRPARSTDPYLTVELEDGRFFLAGCPAMLKLYDTVRLLAPVDVPVLILGESGVGKDVFASLLHGASLRAQSSYISINCAALPSDLLESELFGYEAGAFTGAAKSKPGKFELAHGGTLLLDEIGEMSAPMQAKLLHVLQDGQFSRLGSKAPTRVDVRILAATNIDIEQAIQERAFREDLYYRISAFSVTIPPLRERREEIPYFLMEMMRRSAKTLRQEQVELSPRLFTLVQEYAWPGNLRELSNFVIRMLILQDPAAAEDDLRSRLSQKWRGRPEVAAPIEAPDPANMRSIVKQFKGQTERRLIQEALDSAGWNRRRAAMQLNISYRTLLYKIQAYELKETSRCVSRVLDRQGLGRTGFDPLPLPVNGLQKPLVERGAGFKPE